MISLLLLYELILYLQFNKPRSKNREENSPVIETTPFKGIVNKASVLPYSSAGPLRVEHIRRMTSSTERGRANFLE